MPPMLLCVAPHTAYPLAVPVGLKPPWNQPHVTRRSLSRSPTLRPCIAARLSLLVWFLPEQSSHAGSGSLIIVPMPLASGEATAYASVVGSCVTGVSACTPCVLPEIRLMAPGEDGPNTVLNELSFNA